MEETTSGGFKDNMSASSISRTGLEPQRGEKEEACVKKEAAALSYDHTRPPRIPASDINGLLNSVRGARQNSWEEFSSSYSTEGLYLSVLSMGREYWQHLERWKEGSVCVKG